MSTLEANCSCREVLIADDNEFNLVTFQAMLEMHGLEAKGASNGLEALNKVAAQMDCCPVRVIFMDV